MDRSSSADLVESPVLVLAGSWKEASDDSTAGRLLVAPCDREVRYLAIAERRGVAYAGSASSEPCGRLASSRTSGELVRRLFRFDRIACKEFAGIGLRRLAIRAEQVTHQSRH